MSSSVKLSSDPAGVEIDPTLYRSMIGSLLYLFASRPDIAFSVRVCAHFQAAPKEFHIIVVKKNHLLRQWNIRLWDFVLKRLK